MIRIPAKYAYTMDDLRGVFSVESQVEAESEAGIQVESQAQTDGNPDVVGAMEEPAAPVNADTANQAQIPLCPKCHVEMFSRKASKGKYAGLTFWGCVNFPNCRETRQLSEPAAE